MDSFFRHKRTLIPGTWATEYHSVTVSLVEKQVLLEKRPYLKQWYTEAKDCQTSTTVFTGWHP